MAYFAFAVRFFLLALSFYGYIQYLRKKVLLEFSIGILFSGIGSILFFAGTLNLLPEAVWGIFLGGLVLTGISINQKDHVKDILSIGTVFWGILAVFFLFLLRSSKFIDYDNFSHWALAPKIIAQTNRFPSFQDNCFFFQSYPLGSAAFVYYFTQVLGLQSEWVQMYAQAVLMAGMLVSLFAFARNPVQALSVAICGVFLLCSNIAFTDLSVDSLLPLVALSATAMCLFYGQALLSKTVFVLPYAVFLTSIKNSGLFFVIVLYAYLWITLHKGSNKMDWILLFAAPAGTLLLWTKHVQLVFINGFNSKHSMSVSNYSAIFKEKTMSDISTVIEHMTENIFTVTNPALWLLLFGVVLLLVWKRITKLSCQDMKYTVILAVAAYALYQIGMFGMYLFSMRGNEALTLASYSRYHKTILIFITGLIVIETLMGAAITKPALHSAFAPIGALFCVVILSCCALSPNLAFFQKQQLKGTTRYRFDRLIDQYSIPEGENYLIVTDSGDGDGYLFFLSCYLLRPQNIVIQPAAGSDNVDLSNMDYIIDLDESEKTKAFLSELSPGHTGPVCQLY